MKVLLCIRSLETGGGERQLVALANGLAARGHDMHVAVLRGGGPLEADLDGPALHDLGQRSRAGLAAAARRLARLLRRLRPDVCHGYLGTANLLLTLLRPVHRAPVAWGVRASAMDLTHYTRLHRLHFLLERLASRRAAAIIYNSEAGRAFAESKGFPADRGVVVPNGIDTERFRPQPEAGAALRREWGVPDDAPLVGLPARLDPMKDHDTFLRAAALLAREDPRARFACVGHGGATEIQRLQGLARTQGIAGKVLWPGRLDDMPAVYAAMDLCCLSSAFGEGFPNVLGEAMACGTPCAATDVGDSAVVLGDMGLTVPTGDHAALAEAMHTMLEHAAADPDLPRHLRRRVEERFGLGRMVDAAEALLAGLVGEG